jgi:hypothetical protein
MGLPSHDGMDGEGAIQALPYFFLLRESLCIYGEAITTVGLNVQESPMPNLIEPHREQACSSSWSVLHPATIFFFLGRVVGELRCLAVACPGEGFSRH